MDTSSKMKNKQYFKYLARLLEPALELGAVVGVSSETMHGLLKINSVEHCCDAGIGGISKGALLVSAPDSHSLPRRGTRLSPTRARAAWFSRRGLVFVQRSR